MRIAFVSIPHFACAVEVQRRPELAHRLLIVGDAEQPRRVLDCSPAATTAGVHCGATIRQALTSYPDAIVLPPDPVLYRRQWEAVLGALSTISPELEDDGPGRAYLNVKGLESHYTDDSDLADRLRAAVLSASGLAANVGLGDGKFPAFAAAIENTVIPSGGEAGFLAPPCNCLRTARCDLCSWTSRHLAPAMCHGFVSLARLESPSPVS